MSTRRAVILFVRDAESEGRQKPLPFELAVGGYARLNAAIAGRLAAGLDDVDLIVASDGDAGTIPADHHLRQEGGSFGERLASAIGGAAALGYTDVIAVGNDCPSLDAQDLLEAFARLAGGSSLVGAPARDGGLTLVGARTPDFDRDLFLSLPWQTSRLAAAFGLVGGASLLDVVRRDFDAWSSAEAHRQLALLLALDRMSGDPSALPHPQYVPRRQRALARPSSPAPPRS